MSREMHVCDSCHHQLCTQHVPIFSPLNEEELNWVVKLIHHKSYKKGDIIYLERDTLQSLIIINHGRVKAFRYNPDGKEQILYIFTEGDFLGEKNLLKAQKATYSAEALEDTEVCMINRIDFQRLLMEYPSISVKIIEEMCLRLEKLEKMVQSLGTEDVEVRVNILLMEFVRKFGRKHPLGMMIELPLSREGMANYIGVTRETVSRKLSYLQKEGIIELVGNKKIILRDEEALAQTIQ